ncbi:MAG: hypothetical protein K2N44_17475 [Lachnospiraceae bacterium]|nr:hypothetical protein [Lachnospiraceae bacterium]
MECNMPLSDGFFLCRAGGGVIVIFIIISIILSADMICMQVHAAELELEPKTCGESNPFEFKILYTWTAKGQKFQSYDVSENGWFALTFSDDKIAVFDQDMNFQYELLFESHGAYGALWLDEKLLFVDLRSNTAIMCRDGGMPESFYTIVGPDNYYYKVVEKRSCKQGDDTYYCTNNSRNNSLVHSAGYAILKRVSQDGVEEILYEADSFWVMVSNLWILVIVAMFVVGFFITRYNIKRMR